MEQNKTVVRRWVEAGNDRKLEVFDELFTADTVDHVSGNAGIAWWKEVFSWIGESFPDWQWTGPVLIAEHDLVTVKLDLTGSHQGSRLPFLSGIEPAGTPIIWRHFHLFRLENGLIAEHWASRDDLGVLRQLGAR
ncbi:ester cyclase [Kribbella sp. NBC_01505]|uniref:ester cyclase n=1 Tax=Kribbella sp. NBC_01505 TaxID=2903580 RepID=UPI00386A2D5E